MALGGNGGTARDLDPGRIFTNDPFTADPYTSQLANLSYLQFQQGANLMYPAQSQLIQYAENPNYIGQQRAQAVAGVDQAFDAQAGARGRLLALMGVNPNAAQSAAMARQSALAKATAEAGASNQAAQAAYQNQQGALLGRV